MTARLRVFSLGLLVLLCASLRAEPAQRVLLVSSYHPEFPTFFQQIEGIASVFEGLPILLDIEFMDSKRFNDPVNLDNFQRLLSYKLSQLGHYDVILSADDNALIFALEHQDELFGDTPIIFFGVNNVDRAIEQDANPRVTGVIEAVSMQETVQLMQALHPGIREIVAVTDSTPSGQADLRSFYRLGEQMNGVKMSAISLATLSFEEFAQRLGELDDEKAVLLLSAYRDKRGRSMLFQESLDFITKHLNLPLYHLWYHGLGDGVIGGKVISHYEQGAAAAEMALQVLRGRPVSAIPIMVESPNRYAFDFQELEHFGLTEDLLPEGSTVINRPPSLYREHKVLVWSTAAVICGFLLLIVAMGINIGRRKQVELELRRLRNLLSNIVDSMPSMLVGVDTKGRVVQWNREAEKAMRVLCGKALGRQLAEVFPLLAGEMKKVNQAVRDRKPQKEMKVPWQEGDRMHYSDITVYPLISNGVEGAVIRIDNVTERVRIEEMMVQSEKMLSLGGLAAGMAHEINNPLAGVLQGVQVVRNRISDTLAKNRAVATETGTTIEAIGSYMERRGIIGMLDVITDSGRRAAMIVENMLDFSRKSSSTLTLCNLGELLDKTVELASSDYDLKRHYDFRSIEMIRDYDPFTPSVWCEGNQIQQVFLNILRNGAEAMAEQNAQMKRPCLTLRVMPETGGARVEIADNGCGMDEITRKRVFEPFFTTKDVGAGIGLGLSVSYFIITENHGGAMTVKSSRGNGTRFIIHLPEKQRKRRIDIESLYSLPGG